MRKKFALNLIFLFAANLLVKPFWIFGIDRVVQNRVGAETYGTYFAVFNYSYLLAIILDFGINNFNNRAVSRNHKRAGEYVLNMLTVKFFLALVYFCFTFASAVSTGFSELQMQMLSFLMVNQILLSVILYLRSNVAALQFFKTDSVLSVLDRLLTIVFCLVLLYSAQWQSSFSILWFIYAQTLALFITAVIALGVVYRHTFIKLQFWKWNFTRLILLKSTPFALLALLMGIYYRIDGVMLERMRGATEAGIYAASFRLLDALNMFGYLFATLLLPMFAGMIRRKENLHELVKFSAELMLVMSVIAGVNCYFFQTEIMQLLYQDSTSYWANIFGWLMLNFIPMSSIYIFGTLLTANGSMRVLNWIAAAGVVINVGLNLFLIPAYGALGAAIATLVTQLVTAVAHLAAAQQKFKLSYGINEGIRIFVFALLTTGIAFGLHSLPLDWKATFVLALLISLLAASLLKLVPVRRALSLVKAKAAS